MLLTKDELAYIDEMIEHYRFRFEGVDKLVLRQFRIDLVDIRKAQVHFLVNKETRSELETARIYLHRAIKVMEDK